VYEQLQHLQIANLHKVFLLFKKQ